jgi:hypothetical protein
MVRDVAPHLESCDLQLFEAADGGLGHGQAVCGLEGQPNLSLRQAQRETYSL